MPAVTEVEEQIDALMARGRVMCVFCGAEATVTATYSTALPWAFHYECERCGRVVSMEVRVLRG